MATARSIRQAYDACFADLGLNLSEASLMAFVDEFGPLTQTGLAQRLGLGRAATGSVIDSLEKRGHLERQPNPDDRRVWLVTATTSGARVVRDINARDKVLRARLRAGISRADRHQLADVLVRLGENLSGLRDEARGMHEANEEPNQE